MFTKKKYLIRKDILNMLDRKLRIFDQEGQIVAHANQKAFKLREDVRLYADEARTDEIILIKTGTILDFSATYDLFDSKTGEKFGMLKRKGMQSLMRDEWIVADKDDNQIGILVEDSLLLALMRRFIFNLIPQNYDLLVGEKRVVDFKQNFNPFVYKLNIDLTLSEAEKIDPRIAISAGVLLAFIEGKQG